MTPPLELVAGLATAGFGVLLLARAYSRWRATTKWRRWLEAELRDPNLGGGP